MAFVSWPFDFEPDGETPQEVTEAQFRHTLASAMQSGVGSEGDMAVSALPDSSAVSLTSGYASVHGYSCHNDSATQVPAPANTASQARRYWVVLRLDRDARQITPEIVEGAAASSPSLPTLTRTDSVWEEPLASFRRSGGGGGISELVDYRAVINPSGSRAVHSARRPPHPEPGERIYETDTGREMYYHAGSWRVAADVAYPSAWSPLPLRDGFETAGTGRPPEWRWLAQGRVELRGTIQRTGGDGQIPSGNYIATVPSAAVPNALRRYVGAAHVTSGGHSVRLEVTSPYSSTWAPGRLVPWHPSAYEPSWVALDGWTYDVT